VTCCPKCYQEFKTFCECISATQPTSQLNQASETNVSQSTGQKDEKYITEQLENSHGEYTSKRLLTPLEQELAQAKQSLRIAHEAYIDETHTLRERIKELGGEVEKQADEIDWLKTRAQELRIWHKNDGEERERYKAALESALGVFAVLKEASSDPIAREHCATLYGEVKEALGKDGGG
jgi:predicted RNase H-like nuclease (RuvC/YqgF family)